MSTNFASMIVDTVWLTLIVSLGILYKARFASVAPSDLATSQAYPLFLGATEKLVSC